ncbi:MAG: ParB/RepB/Spo0J family partition protein [Rhodobacteraceae bacterium]|nr:ParB/RepB/Spo0J family partition protein [Paracoccaceae bacterium]
MAKPAKKGLGRGLSALMADIEPAATPISAEAPAPRAPDRVFPIDQVVANPDQPRRQFAEEALDELAASIREKGIIQPLIVRPDPSVAGRFQIVAGERRWRAAQRANLHEVPAIIRDFNDTEVLEVAIIENIQRADLNPLEEAQGYRQLMDRFGHTQDQLAQAMGKSRSHIANLMRLMSLPDAVQEMLRKGELTAGHARALITSDDPTALAKTIVAKGLSVREAEKLAKTAAGGGSKPPKSALGKDADTAALEGDLSAALGMPVAIQHSGDTGKGQVVIRYGDLAALDDLIAVLTRVRG